MRQLKLFLAIMIFVGSWSFISLAQVASPAASPAVAVAAQAAAPVVQAVASSSGPKTGVMAWVESHGGFQMAVLLLMTSALSLLSALRLVLFKFEGIAEDGSNIPADSKVTLVINKICQYLGVAVDFMMGNPKH